MRDLIWRLLTALRLYPHIYFTYSPFKILEFEHLTGDIAWRGDERVLDIGCGIGNHTFLIGRHCAEIVGVDVNPEFVERARWFAGLKPCAAETVFTTDPVERAGFEDESFDRIFSICVLEHIPNHDEVLDHCLRTLKPGGVMHFSVDCLTTVEDPALIEKHRRDHHVQHYFDPDELRAVLTDKGFANVTVEPVFKSDLARGLFERGIREGFNFGRLSTGPLTRRLRAAEAAAADRTDGIFLIARAEKPLSAA